MRRYGVGVVGCGNISGIYLKNCSLFSNLKVVACADIDPYRAKERAQEFGVRKACSVDELLREPDVEIVLNLTVPKAHAEINVATLEAGKHVYTEKPFGITRAEGARTLDSALVHSLRTGGAPDTFLGAGLQTCRKLIDQGAIGRPTSATAFMVCHGHESWHPSVDFHYQEGGGPMLDMGPYYLTALTTLLGPAHRVCGFTSRALGERVITAEKRRGEKIKVKTPTHIAGLIQFENEAVASIVTSFDVWAANVPLLEIHGTEGSLSLPDPNIFGGPVRVWSPKTREWEDVPLGFGYAENSRGLGVADLADAIENDRPARASGELCFHVLDIMQSFYEASESGEYVELASGVGRPQPMGQEGFDFRD